MITLDENFMNKVIQFILRYKINLEVYIGKILSNKINKQESNLKFLEILMPNNRIFSKFDILFGNKFNFSIQENTIYNKFIASENIKPAPVAVNKGIKYPDKVLLLAPKFYGDYPNAVWWDLYHHLQNLSIKVTWLDLLDNTLDVSLGEYLEIFFQNKYEKNLLFLDPLAATERFEQYNSVNEELLNNITTRENFRVIGLLGDIWRSKDKKKIIESVRYFDGYVHIDKISAKKYPQEVKDKFFYFPFVAFDTGKFRLMTKKNVLIFSGQVRDSDRRYWLRSVINLSKKLNTQIKIYSWYNWNQGNALNQTEYVNELNNSQYSLSLTQKGLDHWLITARALQSLLSGCTLIHQEGKNYKTFEGILTPYKDYIPFTNLFELYEVMKFISDYPNESKKIGENGALKIRNVFQEVDFWNFCLNLN
jgi:hypothetical protein